MIEPSAIAQVGIKIPVHVMTKQGWEIIKNHLQNMDNRVDLENIVTDNAIAPVVLNSTKGIKVLSKKDLHNCSDCPRPCV